MKLTRCVQGHFYDADMYEKCPHCGINLSYSVSQVMTDNRTIAMHCHDKTVSMPYLDDDITVSGMELNSDDKTIGVYSEKYHGEPVVGWLVCTEGPERGRDYRLYPSKNRIVRASNMDVFICDDMQIVRDTHFSIIYEPRKNEFIALSGNGPVTINETPLVNSLSLAEGDRIHLGITVLTFIPYCKGERKWKKE